MNCSGTVRLNPLGALIVTAVVILIVYFNYGASSYNETALIHSTVSLKSLLAASIEISKRGGLEVKTIREQADIGEKSKGKTKEGANNPVTDGDMKSHQAMYYGLRKTFPRLNVISEEHDASFYDMSQVKPASIDNSEVDDIIPDSLDELIPAQDVDIWIDPLDATQEYTENLLNYVTTMVCVAVKGRPTIGVIYKPFSDEVFWGWHGQNKFSKNLESIQNGGSEKFRLIVSRSHSGKVHEVAEQAFGKEVEVTPAGGAGFKVLEVASGRQDAYIHVTLIKKWDLCAGNAILNALGGNMTDLKGNLIDYSGKENLNAKNEGGVLAALSKHSQYLSKFKNLHL